VVGSSSTASNKEFMAPDSVLTMPLTTLLVADASLSL
jgi:hypothetical protein